jgi:hypothetical protein
LLVEEFSSQTIFGVWSNEETKKFILAIEIYGNKNWKNAQISFKPELQNSAEINGSIVFNQD